MSDLSLHRAQLENAKTAYEETRRRRPSPEPAGDAPTFSDCAASFDRAALAFRVASALGDMGYFAEAAAEAAKGSAIEEAALSCDNAASGGTIEV